MKITEEKGITLIALIITIIVMLILVGVSIAVAINGGLFSTARKAKTETQVELDKETLTSAVVGALNDNLEVDKTKLESYLSGWIVEGEIAPYTCTSPNNNIFEVANNGTITRISRPGLKVGDYINYTPDTAENYTLEAAYSGYTSNQTISQDSNLKWRILKIYEDGTIDLVSDVPTSGKVYFQGPKGYNNGVYLLHDMCENLYSNKNLEITARSMNIEDIESQMTEAGKAERDAYSNGVATYGTTKTYTGSNSYYPNLYEKENGSGINTNETKTGGINVSDKTELDTSLPGYKQANASGLTVTQTYYNLPFATLCNKELANILGSSNIYWIASRYVYCDINCATFGICYANNSIHGRYMIMSDIKTVDNGSSLRPVVSINPNIKITAHKGTLSDMHEI